MNGSSGLSGPWPPWPSEMRCNLAAQCLLITAWWTTPAGPQQGGYVAKASTKPMDHVWFGGLATKNAGRTLCFYSCRLRHLFSLASLRRLRLEWNCVQVAFCAAQPHTWQGKHDSTRRDASDVSDGDVSDASLASLGCGLGGLVRPWFPWLSPAARETELHNCAKITWTKLGNELKQGLLCPVISCLLTFVFYFSGCGSLCHNNSSGLVL